MNIALFAGMLENDCTKSVCEGAMQAAKEMDANLFILPAGMVDAIYVDKESNYYRYQYNTLFSCVQTQAFDAVVFEHGTITSFLDDQKAAALLEQFKGIPMILLAGDVEGYSHVRLNNRVGLEDAFTHLVTTCKCKKIGFISGPKTNQDAIERLQVFYDSMEKHHLDCGEDWVSYGDFSEFSEHAVEELLDRHPDIEAIAFANDQMAIGGYKVFERRGIVPGRDIYVTGFDDSTVAMQLEPHLTTVRADAKELAYHAVKECPNIIAGELVQKEVNSRLIVRASSGQSEDGMSVLSMLDNTSHEKEALVSQLVQTIYEQFFNSCYDNQESIQMRNLMKNYFTYYFDMVNEDGSLSLDKVKYEEEYFKFSEIYLKGHIELEKFFVIGHILYAYISEKIKQEQDCYRLLEITSAADRKLIQAIAKNRTKEDERSKSFETILTHITRDMLQFSAQGKRRYEVVLDRLQRMKFDFSYILTYGESITNQPGDEWTFPKKVYMRGYQTKNEIQSYNRRERRVQTKDIFSTNILPSDRRFDLLVLPLFANENQYGLMLSELPFELFMYASRMACQVSVSIEIVEVLRKQNAVKKELERNLAKAVANNKVLDDISRMDPLTNILNRRGYMDTVEKIINDSNNYGKRAIAVYADMDGLKIVNDEFGHDEGDYSLRTIADILTESFRQSDVVGRMGGDEFAAFAIVNSENFAETIRMRIKEIADKHNESSDKPYYVNISVGTCEFVIEEDVNLARILNKADVSLYEHKRNKEKIIHKNK